MLDQLLISKKNQLNFIRLILALLVLLFHAAPIGGYQWNMAWPTLRPSTDWGGFAVGGFFSLSGLLIGLSAARNSTYKFIASRFLRIYPAYFFVILISSFVLSPIIWKLQHGGLLSFPLTGKGGAIDYFIHNITLPIASFKWGIGDIFLFTPYGELSGISAINGSLWSIPVEVRCYIVALLIVKLRNRIKFLNLDYIVFVVSFTATYLNDLNHEIASYLIPEIINVNDFRWVTNFMIGLIISKQAHKIEVNKNFILFVISIYAVSSVIGGIIFRIFGLGITCLIFLMITKLLPDSPFQIFENDLSYGFYLWAFPIQQTLSYLGFNANKFLYVLLSVVLTFLISLFSWKVIEKPAINLKSKVNE